jgi:hypothetical protein
MKKSTHILWLEIQEQFFRIMEPLSAKFSNEIKSGISTHKYLSTSTTSNDEYYHLFEFELINNKNYKIIYCYVYFGYTADNNLFLRPDISVRKLTDVSKSISIKRYIKFRNIDYPLPNGIDYHSEESYKNSFEPFFKYWLKIMSSDEFQTILYTDKWLDIPIDMSEYK